MKNFLYLVLICVGIWWSIDSCSGGDKEKSEEERTEVSEQAHSNPSSKYDFEGYSFDGPQSVYGLLAGKQFIDERGNRMTIENGQVNFNGNYGTVTSLNVSGSRMARMAVAFPGFPTQSHLMVTLQDDDISVVEPSARIALSLKGGAYNVKHGID